MIVTFITTRLPALKNYCLITRQRVTAYVEKIGRPGETSITATSYALSFTGIVLVRYVLELFSGFRHEQYVFVSFSAIAHFLIFYIAAVLCITGVLLIGTKKSLKEIRIVCLFGFFIIWLGPIVDLIVGGQGAYHIGYLFVTGKELIYRFLTFFGGHITSGITLGLQVEIALIIIASFIYVRIVTKSFWRALFSAVAIYSSIFLLVSLPSIVELFLPESMLFGQGVSGGAFYQSIEASHLIENNIEPQFIASRSELLEFGFDKTTMGIHIWIGVGVAVAIGLLAFRKKFFAVLKNSRPERIAHYLLLILFGVTLGGIQSIQNWVDVQMLLLILLSFTSAWLYSVCQNDLYDRGIDTVSNASRPLITGQLTAQEMSTIGNVFLCLSLIAGYAASPYTLFFVGLFMLLYHIYSVWPLRLKRFIFVGSFLIGLACLCAVMAGFLLTNDDKRIGSFPLGLAIGIVALFTITSNVRDIKDIEGDREQGIKTLPVRLGPERAKKIIAATIGFCFFATPLYLKLPIMYPLSGIAAILCWRFITAEKYKEQNFFIVYLFYVVVLILAIALKT